MSTRSFIHVQRADGKWARIYCHFDGYWEGVGQTLQHHYNSQEKAEALVALGDISSLGEEIGEKHDFDFNFKFFEKYGSDDKARYNDPEYIRLQKMCNVYGRDRGETGVEPVVGDTLREVFASQEYMYVWRDDQWLGMARTKDLSKLRPLAEILMEYGIPLKPDTDDLAEETTPSAEAPSETPVWAAP
jgi:hypothetical protein